MTYLADYKLKIFVDALQAHFDQEPISDQIEDDLAVLQDDWTLYDDSGADILADMRAAYKEIKKGRRKIAQQKYNQSEAGQAARHAWRQSKEGKASEQASEQKRQQSEAGKVSRQVARLGGNLKRERFQKRFGKSLKPAGLPRTLPNAN